MEKLTTDEIIIRSKKIHGDEYDYSEMEYLGATKKIKIECLKHGEFLQRPYSHLFGYGCPKCSHFISKPEVKWLDSLNLPNDKEHRQVPIKIGSKHFKVDRF